MKSVVPIPKSEEDSYEKIAKDFLKQRALSNVERLKKPIEPPKQPSFDDILAPFKDVNQDLPSKIGGSIDAIGKLAGSPTGMAIASLLSTDPYTKGALSEGIDKEEERYRQSVLTAQQQEEQRQKDLDDASGQLSSILHNEGSLGETKRHHMATEDIERAKINAHNAMSKIKESETAKANSANLQSLGKDLGELENMAYNLLPNTGNKLINKGLSLGKAATIGLGMGDEPETQFESKRNLLIGNIARTLGSEKGILSNKDIERLKDVTPKFGDTPDQAKGKLKELKNMLGTRIDAYNNTHPNSKIDKAHILKDVSTNNGAPPKNNSVEIDYHRNPKTGKWEPING